MSTSEFPAIVEQLDSQGVLSTLSEDGIQAWLAEVMQMTDAAVRPGWLSSAAKVPDWQNFCTFMLTDLHRLPPITIEATDEDETIEYHVEGALRVLFRGADAYTAAFYLADACELSQNIYPLQGVGLGITDADIEALSQEQQGQTMTPQAVVRLSFNFTYRRTWAIKAIVEAPFSIKRS